MKSTYKFLAIGKHLSNYVLILAGEGLALYINSLKPRGQLFSVLDPTISYPSADHDTVSVLLAYILCFVVPAAIVLIVDLSFGPGRVGRRFKLFSWSLLGLLAAVVVTDFFTELIKFIIGRPRPDFLDRCKPDTQRAQAAFTATAVTLFNSTICTNTDVAVLAEGFRSFPSGHSTTSFAGLTYLSLWTAGRFQVFVPHSTHGKHLYAYILSIVPLLLATFVGCSRVYDYRHRGFDVLGSAALGIFWAIVAYRYYYPWVSSPVAGTPWMIMIEENASALLLPTTASRQGQDTHISDVSQVETVPAEHGDIPMETVPLHNRARKPPRG